MDPKPVRQAHPQMAHPKAPTRLTVSGGPKATPHLSQPDSIQREHPPEAHLLLAVVGLVLIIAVVALLVWVLA